MSWSDVAKLDFIIGIEMSDFNYNREKIILLDCERGGVYREINKKFQCDYTKLKKKWLPIRIVYIY